MGRAHYYLAGTVLSPHNRDASADGLSTSSVKGTWSMVCEFNEALPRASYHQPNQLAARVSHLVRELARC